VVTVILIRHAPRDKEIDDATSPLSSDGVLQAKRLGAALSERGLIPTVFLSSAWAHAIQTATIIREVISAPQAVVVPVDPLTPHTATEARLPYLELAASTSVDLSTLACFACVGHEPRVGQLAEDLTGEKLTRLEYAEAWSIQAPLYDDLRQGHGTATRITAPLPLE
jgi:phosphohistidine phosphatase SixA